MKDSGEFSEEEIRQMWNDLGKKINNCVAVMSKIEEEMKIYLNKMKGEASKSSLEVSQLNTATKNALSKINSLLDKTEKVFDEERLKHIAENFIRKAVELKMDSLEQNFLVEANKQVKPKMESLYKIIEGAKKNLRRDIKSEKKEITKLKKDFVKRENARKDRNAAESEENTKTATKSVTKESNSI
ncbi:MAG: hypothetical protein ACP5NZ_02545 [Nanobdellota archaeon]